MTNRELSSKQHGESNVVNYLSIFWAKMHRLMGAIQITRNDFTFKPLLIKPALIDYR